MHHTFGTVCLLTKCLCLSLDVNTPLVCQNETDFVVQIHVLPVEVIQQVQHVGSIQLLESL